MPVAGSTIARVIAITEPSAKTASPAGTRMSMWVEPGRVSVEIVIDELAPGIHHPGDALGFGDAGIALADHHIADHPRVRPADGVEMPSAKCAGPIRAKAVPAALRSASVMLLPEPSIER